MVEINKMKKYKHSLELFLQNLVMLVNTLTEISKHKSLTKIFHCDINE